MATNGAPMDMMSADPAASASGDSEGASDSDTGGFVIEIEVDGQGNITVSLEDAAQEASEGQGGAPEDESQATPAKSIEEALKIAKKMYLAESGEAGVSPQDAWNQEAALRKPPTATA